MFDLTPAEKRIFNRLNTPQKIQDFIQTIPYNFEQKGQTLNSPREVLREKKAHCMEGALLAAAIFWRHHQRPLLLDLRTVRPDYDHVVALFVKNGRFGAISKTNHSVLLYRDPVYKSVRELVMSYFHEYFLQDGKKTLRNYSQPFDLRSFGSGWVTEDDNLWYLDKALDKAPHIDLFDKKTIAVLRKADKIQIQASNLQLHKK